MSLKVLVVAVLAGFMGLALLASVGVANAQQKKKCEAQTTPRIQKVEGTGKGCTKEAAIQNALDNLADSKCSGENDPKCPADAQCQSGMCKVTTKKDGVNKEKCTKIALEGCEEKKGFECTVSGSFLCTCRCR